MNDSSRPTDNSQDSSSRETGAPQNAPQPRVAGQDGVDCSRATNETVTPAAWRTPVLRGRRRGGMPIPATAAEMAAMRARREFPADDEAFISEVADVSGEAGSSVVNATQSAPSVPAPWRTAWETTSDAAGCDRDRLNNISPSPSAIAASGPATSDETTALQQPSPPVRSNEPSSLPLLSHHLVELRRSGLNDTTISLAGIYSESDSSRLAEILGWRGCPRKMAPAIVFPYRRPDGSCDYRRIKPDNPRIQQGSPVRYESPKGRPNEIYLPPNTLIALQNPTQELLLSEGEKKALVADQNGFPCIGLVGVFGWKLSKREELLPSLERIEWQGRDVFIVYDSDVREKADVQDAETRLAAHLQRRGANVKVVRLPDGPPDEDGKPTKFGLDDYLVAHGPDELQALLDAAEEPAEPDDFQVKVPAGQLDPCTEVQRFLDHYQQDGVNRLRYWRGSWYLHDAGHYGELTKDEVQGILVRHLNDSTFGLTTHITGNHMMQLRAQASLPDTVSPPAWIGGPPRNWPDNEILACPSGLVHLPSLVRNQEFFCPATPRFFTLVALDYECDINAGRPDRWLEFLNQLWPDDAESICLLQEFFGYCLTVDTSQQKILLIVGPRRSGKGTIARVLRRLIGSQNVAGPTLAGLGTNFGLWPLLGKSVAIISDARLGHRTDSMVVTERLLSISGEDALTVDRKNMSAVTGKLDARLMMLTNELPRFSDASGALAGRMLILRLLRSWYGQEDPGLYGRLERELPGILLWAIEGWRRLRERGHFLSPGASEEIQDELDDLTSPVAAFIRQRCFVGPEHEVVGSELYAAYRTWCQQENTLSIPNRSVFGRDLRAAVATIGRGQQHDGTRLYRGIGLRSTTGEGPQHPQQVPQQANHGLVRPQAP